RGRREGGENHERLVERVALRIGAEQFRLAIGVHGAEHVVVDDHVLVAELLGGLRPVADRGGVAADLGGRKNRPEPHPSTNSATARSVSTSVPGTSSVVTGDSRHASR